MKSEQKIMAKEAKELERLQNEKTKKPIPMYMGIAMVVLSLIRLLDEFVTSAPASVQSSIVMEFFVDGMGMSFEQGLSMMSLMTTALLLFSVAAVFFVALCDKVGRKKILIVSTIGMTSGMLLCSLSTNLIIHLIGRAIITFFVATDVHQIYIMEIAPSDKRSTYTQITTVFGSVGVMLVAVVRMLYTEGNSLNWRGVFLLPSIAGVIAVVAAILFIRETDVFLDARIQYLQKPLEERRANRETEKDKKEQEQTRSGLGSAAKYVITHKQTRSILLAQIPLCFATMAFATYYESIMTASGMNIASVNLALLVYPIAMAVVAVIVGQITDKLGRRPAGVFTAVCAFVSMFLFILLAGKGANPLLVGAFLGLELGAYWRYNETITLSLRESVPTQIRASAGSFTGLISVALSLVAGVVMSVILSMYSVEQVCLVAGAVSLGLSTIIYIFMVKETKGTDLNQV